MDQTFIKKYPSKSSVNKTSVAKKEAVSPQIKERGIRIEILG